jgi:putative ABC transport system permease protein
VISVFGSVGALGEQAGAPIELVVPWPTVAGVVLLCLVLGVAASVVPARRVVGGALHRAALG